MQLLQIADDLKLSELSDLVGSRNIDSVLNANQLQRTPNIGEAFKTRCTNTITDFLTPTETGEIKEVTWQRKQSILNRLSPDSDIFEAAALQGDNGWILLSELGTLPQHLRMPDDVVLSDASDVLGNNQPVSSEVYDKVSTSLATPPHTIDSSLFGEYSAISSPGIFYTDKSTSGDTLSEFPIPWGAITLYSSLSNENRDFPVYPEEVSDKVEANYITMPDMLYQYEPWQVYASSGPRNNTYRFKFHRDMWNGDHNIENNGANELIRFCMANCYPEYKGSAVYTSTVTLYVRGHNLITGVLTDVDVNWSGPIGHDGWYLMCELSLTIIEVSPEPLDYERIRAKLLIE